MILIVNVAEWGEAHLKQNFPCDCGQWFVSAFGGNQEKYTTWRPRIGDPIPQQNFDGIVISGSAASVYDDEEWITQLSNSILEWDQQKLPILGVCFGHQLIAQIFGGKVEKNKRGWEVGSCDLDLTEAGKSDLLFHSIPPRFKVMQSHQDIVTQLPPGAECLASSAICEFQSFKIGNRIRTVQFHPEYTVDQMKFIMAPRREILEASGINFKNALVELAPTLKSRTILANFEQFFVQQSHEMQGDQCW